MSEAKVVAILGAGPGLGVAIARRFAREGYAIALMARSEEKLQAIQTEIEGSGGVAHSFPVDATHPDSVAEGFAQVQSQLGAVSVLVYNAGVFPMAGILELTPEKFSQSWQINCFGAFLAAQQVLSSMLEQEKGTILFTGATGSLRGSAGLAGLSVGKFGLRALAQSLAREFAPEEFTSPILSLMVASAPPNKPSKPNSPQMRSPKPTGNSTSKTLAPGH